MSKTDNSGVNTPPKVLYLNVDTDETLEQVINAIKSRPEIDILSFDDFFINCETADIVNIIITNTLPDQNIRSLCFNGNQMHHKVAAKIIEVLKNNNTLDILDFDLNYIGNKGALEIIKIIPTTNITTLSLNDNEIYDNEIYDNEIYDNGIIGFAEILKKCTKLSSLSLGFNRISDEGAKSLAKALPCMNLFELYLNGNNIGASGVKELAKRLEGNKTLSILSLSSNGNDEIQGFDIEAIKQIANLIDNTNLTKIYLSANKISDEGAEILAEALKKNTSLEEVKLGWNNIGNDGAEKLLDAIPYTSITKLELQANNISQHILAVIQEILDYNLRRQGIKGERQQAHIPEINYESEDESDALGRSDGGLSDHEQSYEVDIIGGA